MVNHLVYDAFGRVTSESNPAVDSLFLFTARPFDADTGLQNNLNRWYDPAVGRWLSEDPIGFGGGDGNLYRYVLNRVPIALDWAGLDTQRYTLRGSGTFVHIGYGRTGGEHFMDYTWALSYTADDDGCVLFIQPPKIIYSNVRWAADSGSFSFILGLSVTNTVDLTSLIADRYEEVVGRNGECVYLAKKVELEFRWIQRRTLYLGVGVGQLGVGFDMGPSWDVLMDMPQRRTVFVTAPCCCRDKLLQG
ncbi:MAG: RHS repeat-associated core domain-containing protein [Thermogutta sp.]|nr:RHS repeat-associated core domain-containing protein [Thermogutta sp.]